MTELDLTGLGFPDVTTGEMLPATVENAATVILAARDMRARVNEIVAQATEWLAHEAERQGTKTLHGGGETITLSGGVSDEYDAQDLMELLRDAGCPEDRIEAAVTTIIDYKVNRSVLKQLQVNQDYAAAIDLARREVEKPWRASIKLRSNT